MYLFFTLITWIIVIISAAVGDSERVEVKSGGNVTLRVETPGNVRKVMLKKCENRTEEPIILYCSPEEEKRGCSVKKSDRFSIRSDTESLSVIFGDARVSDEGCYTVSYIDVDNNVTEKLFEVTVSEQPLTTPAISTKGEETLGTNGTNTTVSEERNHRITYSIMGVTAGVIVVIYCKKSAGEADTGESLEMVVVNTTLSVNNEEGPVHGA
ncbi:uncharacterized protein LOC132118697 [Carassius carassius]|uniref:uncharacterized protein LOC132118697 n=1 Tax=Carassius carassius TaxID=217509 RepID=UPI0028694422|nr:uncharacterized protein LOC132118697 [Carassius carassius]